MPSREEQALLQFAGEQVRNGDPEADKNSPTRKEIEALLNFALGQEGAE